MSKTQKINKEFLLTDDTVNCYGFRLLTAGYQIDEFKKNPIGYYMHDREDGVVVKWEDLRVEGDKVYGKPVINLSNDRGQQTVDEINNGFLNGASVGHIVALEYSEDPAMMLPGQTGPTITKWYNRECSLVDVPGNNNALALYDKDGHVINLADFKTQTIKMEKIFLTPAQLTKLGLKADSKQEDADTAIENLVSKAGKVEGLTNDLAAKERDLNDAKEKIRNLEASATTNDVKGQLEKALQEKKITVELKAVFEKQYADKPNELKEMLAAMKPFSSVVPAADKEDAVNTEDLKAEYEKLDKNGGLEALKASNETKFKELYKARWGKEYGA